MDKSSEILDGAVATSVTSADSTQLPENILGLLNDDCITEIFRQSTNLDDLVNASSACKRFRECAMSLKFMFRSATIESTRRLNSRKDVVSAHTAPLLFKNFGHLVESVEWRLAGNGKREAELFEDFAESCGKTLKKLKITDYNPYFNKRNQFLVLEELILHNAEPKQFPLDSPLKHLEIRNFRHNERANVSDLDVNYQQPWFVRKFPHLESVRFNTTDITDYTIFHFLSFNRNLRALEADSPHLTPWTFAKIALFSTNIERLQIKSAQFYKCATLDDKWLHLRKLRKLSEFGMSGRLSLQMLLNIFAENNIPIESLEVDVRGTGKGASFPTIETLNKLQCICRSDVDESCLVNFVKSQPALQTLQITNIGSNITVESIEKILKFGKNLTDFELSGCRCGFDVESYNRILMLARNRVRVRIVVSTRTRVDVPGYILEMNRKWLRIIFEFYGLSGLLS